LKRLLGSLSVMDAEEGDPRVGRGKREGFLQGTIRHPGYLFRIKKGYGEGIEDETLSKVNKDKDERNSLSSWYNN